jgi:pimeloyl-ACP methyl ester carboxylesterase
LDTHIEDVVRVASFEDLPDLMVVGTSSSGGVITGVDARIPDRIASLLYLDAFLPSDNRGILDLMPTERRETLERLVATEGDGWLLPRFAPPPWPDILRNMWQITDEADIEWMVPRLCPTPVRHFTDPVIAPPRASGSMQPVYIRCTGTRMPTPPFDAAASRVRAAKGWRYLEIDVPHIAYISHPDEVAAALTDLVAIG